MTPIIIAASKLWKSDLKQSLENILDTKVIILTKKEQLTEKNIRSISPSWIFFPHWSFMIPKSIYQNWKCVVFHMTDLPYGRGGSPLQNLIVRGHKKTKVSAISVVDEVDAGDIYLKEGLDLSGSAQEIYERATSVIETMIIKIMKENPFPVPQKGEIVRFKRRKLEESNIKSINNINHLYDHIRMLDAKGYPHAYFNSDEFCFEFTQAYLENNEIYATVKIRHKEVLNDE